MQTNLLCMGDKKEKEKGGTWNRLMAMKMLGGGKASTGTARAAKDEPDNKRRSAIITGSSTVAAQSEGGNKRAGLKDLFKSGTAQ